MREERHGSGRGPSPAVRLPAGLSRARPQLSATRSPQGSVVELPEGVHEVPRFRCPPSANAQIQRARIEACLAIMVATVLEQRESILKGGEATVDRLVQIDQTTLDHEH